MSPPLTPSLYQKLFQALNSGTPFQSSSHAVASLVRLMTSPSAPLPTTMTNQGLQASSALAVWTFIIHQLLILLSNHLTANSVWAPVSLNVACKVAVGFLDGFNIVAAEVAEFGPGTHVDDVKVKSAECGLWRFVC